MTALSPKVKRNIARILPFGFIWLVIGWLNDLYYRSLTGFQVVNPDTDIDLTIPVFIFASFAVFLVGVVIGTLEMVIFEKRFSKFTLVGKFFSKLVIYALILFVVMMMTYPIAAALEIGESLIHPEVLEKTSKFLYSATFINTSIQLSIQIFISLIYATMSENLGHNVLKNLFTGKYHRPKVERRIFMFLDMKQSTTIAESLGHERYFDFLRLYYSSMSDAIINNYGEVYQYVGDEVVITWDATKGFENNNAMNCFFKLKKKLAEQEQAFLDDFGWAPDFKAGVHIGDVTTGEIGALKKEIVYTGDVLNTAARLQGLCKEYEVDVIFSEAIKSGLVDSEHIQFKQLGDIVLRGKTLPTNIYSATEAS